jgi:polysaccharide deacetylase 2 family uncharacterized protein YibQ
MAKLALPVETIKQNIWPIINGLLLLGLVGLLVVLFGGGDHLAQRATKEGRRIAVVFKTGEILGNPLTLPKPKKKEVFENDDIAPEELPAIIPDTSTDNTHQMKDAVPANFVGEKLEGHSAAKPEYEYPDAVKQEPGKRQTAIAAPAKTVIVTDLENSPPGHPLPNAPIDALVDEISDDIKIPKISSDGKRPWEAYGKKFSDSSEPLVAIIVSGLGMNNATQNAFRLNENFTLSLSPYGKEVAMWGSQARNGGHEVLVDLPMQTADFPATDPGPKGLLSSNKPSENLDRLHWIMSRFSGYVGLLSTIDTAIPPAVIQNCLSDIGARGLLMVNFSTETETEAKPQGGNKESEMGLVSLTADSLIDGEINPTEINAQLTALVATAKEKGQAIGLAHAYPLTLQMLQDWQKTLAEQGVRLAPLSAIAARVKE